jgi:hypothetical protein
LPFHSEKHHLTYLLKFINLLEMTNIKYLISVVVVTALTFFIFSCSNDSNQIEQLNNLSLESRTSNSACSPQTLFTEYTSCTHTTLTRKISFKKGLSLFSNSSVIANLCPDLEVSITFTHTTCQFAGGGELHFVYDLSYDLAAMISACPALQTEINTQTSLGNQIGFLDLLDHEIGIQTEYTLAFEAAIQNQLKYLCSNGKYYSVKYVKNTCYEWRALPDPKTGIYTFRKINCNATVCCARSNNYCVQSYINGLPNIGIGTITNYQKFEGTCPLECTHDCGAPNPNEI